MSKFPNYLFLFNFLCIEASKTLSLFCFPAESINNFSIAIIRRLFKLYARDSLYISTYYVTYVIVGNLAEVLVYSCVVKVSSWLH